MRGDTPTAVQATLRYDPHGRLLEVAGGGATTRFLYDGDELLVEYNIAGAILRRYVHGPGADDPLVWYEGSGFSDPRYPHVDHQGSITAVASGTSAGPHVINSYREFRGHDT